MAIVRAAMPMTRRRINYQVRGVGSLASDCSAGNAQACQEYYATQYATAPSVIAAANPQMNATTAGVEALQETAQYAPQVYRCQTCTGLSVDPSVYAGVDREKYIQQLNAQAAADQVNAENSRRFATFVQGYANWLQNGSRGSMPTAPVYMTIEDWYAQNPGLTSGGLISATSAPVVSGVSYANPAPVTSSSDAGRLAAGTRSASNQPVSSPNVPRTTSTSVSDVVSSTLETLKNAVTGGAQQPADQGQPQAAAAVSSNWFDGIPNWAVLSAAAVGAVLLLKGRR